MHRTSKQPGFTLLEVLVTVVLVVLVSFLSLGMISRMSSIQGMQKQSYILSTQLQSVMDKIGTDIIESNTGRASTNLNTLNVSAVVTEGDTYASAVNTASGIQLGQTDGDDLLVVRVPLRDVYGKALSSGETRVYCAELQKDPSTNAIIGKRLARYILPIDTVSINRSLVKCTPDGIQNGFGLSSPPTQIDYLTDPTILIRSLRFWPTWYKDLGTSDVYQYWGQGAAAVTIEIAAQYYAQNTFGSTEVSRTTDASTAADSQIVLRKVVNRNSLFLATQ
jgi:prepilin-type N-terminal cleavage/methylation domain-containing protein